MHRFVNGKQQSEKAQDRFVLHGQPIVHLAGSKPAKVELLIRMREVRAGTARSRGVSPRSGAL
jgi:EAL domain-containing protein (putative c-di-GMP-specific phosphodiesterase class I)